MTPSRASFNSHSNENALSQLNFFFILIITYSRNPQALNPRLAFASDKMWFKLKLVGHFKRKYFNFLTTNKISTKYLTLTNHVSPQQKKKKKKKTNHVT